jgi:hypothetical protein
MITIDLEAKYAEMGYPSGDWFRDEAERLAREWVSETYFRLWTELDQIEREQLVSFARYVLAEARQP